MTKTNDEMVIQQIPNPSKILTPLEVCNTSPDVFRNGTTIITIMRELFSLFLNVHLMSHMTDIVILNIIMCTLGVSYHMHVLLQQPQLANCSATTNVRNVSNVATTADSRQWLGS